jgi:hypothetical protein
MRSASACRRPIRGDAAVRFALFGDATFCRGAAAKSPVYNGAALCEFAVMRSSSDSLEHSGNASLTRFEMPDASLSQGALYAVVYVIFALTLTIGAVWLWPRLGPWVWAHI